MIDSHCHLDGFAARGELTGVIERAQAAGVTGLIAIGTEPGDWRLQGELAAAHPAVIDYTVGLHPCNVADGWETAVEQIEAFWTAPKLELPVALGECGLDRFHLPKDNPAEAERIFAMQRSAFEIQLQIAKRLSTPIVVHSRGAFRESVDLITASGVDWSRVVFHCFVEGAAEMAELNRLGGRGSFTGITTYKTAEPVRMALKEQGMGRLMIETDAPWLAPVPHRGKPCEPAYVRLTAEHCASLLGVPWPEFDRVTTENTKGFFGLE